MSKLLVNFGHMLEAASPAKLLAQDSYLMQIEIETKGAIYFRFRAKEAECAGGR